MHSAQGSSGTLRGRASGRWRGRDTQVWGLLNFKLEKCTSNLDAGTTYVVLPDADDELGVHEEGVATIAAAARCHIATAQHARIMSMQGWAAAHTIYHCPQCCRRRKLLQSTTKNQKAPPGLQWRGRVA
jgi:hypothetical protein